MNRHTDWTAEERTYLEQLIAQEPQATYREYAENLTKHFDMLFTGEAIRKFLSRSKKNNISYMNQKNAEEPKPDELLQVMIQSQKTMQQMDDRQTTVTLDINDNKPIGICFTGDWHVGGLYTEHEQMLKDFEIIRDTEGIYNVTMGDYADNYITRSHAGGSFEQVITADKQKDICEHLFTKYLAENNLVVIKGNHDNWSNKETGEDWVKYIARKINSPYLWYGGEINLRIGNVVYKIHAHHSYKYNSSINTTNSQRNLFASTHADIIALGHLHHNEVHDKKAGGRDTVWMRTGSYKITDDYSQWIGGYRADERVPMVILWPDRKKILPFRSIYDGIKHLEMVRK